MKVNIVWVTPNGDRILDRLARLLAEQTGWSLSTRPDKSADLNYDMVYIDLAQRFTDWQFTPWAAYFSHYEPDTPYKKLWWDTALPLTQVQTATASQYLPLLNNPVMITPPIEPCFKIMERSKNTKPLIGVSGFVDKHTGRKGEKLVARLATEYNVVASGEGWPVRMVNQRYSELPGFYRSLDIYLCSSLIEGIPMPPLEALACGIPIVIPQGVGMLDDLTDIKGIKRFRAGDYDAMKTAIDEMLSELKKVDRQKLADCVAGYTPEAWAKSHVRGLERIPDKANIATFENLTIDQHGQRGVYYVAYGKPARDCAASAIDTFKKHMPDIPVALVSDKPLGAEDHFIEYPDFDIGGRAAKIKINDLAPKDWTYVCYLDADTEIIATSTFLWEVIEDGWDMIICKNPSRFHIASQMRRSDNADECDDTFRFLGTDQVVQLNGGVFAFQRNERTKAFFDCWYEEWRKYGKRDQGALLRALFKHPLKLYVLGNEWNTITRYDSPEVATWLLHYPMTARRWRGIVHYRLDDPGAWKAVQEFESTNK